MCYESVNIEDGSYYLILVLVRFGKFGITLISINYKISSPLTDIWSFFFYPSLNAFSLYKLTKYCPFFSPYENSVVRSLASPADPTASLAVRS